MKSIRKVISTLWFDHEVVDSLKEQNVSRDILYTHLISGKISLKEYVTLI